MLQLYYELIKELLLSIPFALGEWMPLCLGGAALFSACYYIRVFLRRR